MSKPDATDTLIEELRETNRLLRALIAISSAETGLAGMSSSERILLLNRAGLKPSTIAEILGLSSNSVNVRLSEMRKRAKLGKDES